MSISMDMVPTYASLTFVDRVHFAILVSLCDKRESKYVLR